MSTSLTLQTMTPSNSNNANISTHFSRQSQHLKMFHHKHVFSHFQPKIEQKPLDVIYQGCADTKLCFGVPQNCIEKGDCKAIVAVFVAGDKYTFELQAPGNPKYVAAGLSMDNKMGDDSAMECVRNDNGRVNLFTSWTYPKEEPYVSRSDSPQEIVQLIESSVIDGKLYCKFSRDVVSVVKGNTFDLANNIYNLMIVAGNSMKGKDLIFISIFMMPVLY